MGRSSWGLCGPTSSRRGKERMMKLILENKTYCEIMDGLEALVGELQKQTRFPHA